MGGRMPASVNAKNVQIIVPLRYLSNFWRNLEKPLINCQINLKLTCSTNFAITNSIGARTFRITNASFYIPLVTLLTQYNAQLLRQLNPGLNRRISWNKYFIKYPNLNPDWNLDYVLNLSFQVVNRFFAL